MCHFVHLLSHFSFKTSHHCFIKSYSPKRPLTESYLLELVAKDMFQKVIVSHLVTM